MQKTGALLSLVLQFALAARPMEGWLDARPLGPAHGAAAMLDASGGLFDRAIVANATDDERLLAADASEPVARLRFSDGAIAGGSALVTGDAAQQAAIALVGSVAWCHVDATSGQPCIVAENLLAKADGTGTRIACTARTAADCPGLAFALNRGVDALVLDSDASDAVREAAAIAKAQRAETAEPDEDAAAARDAPAGPVSLEQWTVSGVSDGGVADRVAVDFTTLLSPDEGLLVGSSAKALAMAAVGILAAPARPRLPHLYQAEAQQGRGAIQRYSALFNGIRHYSALFGAIRRYSALFGSIQCYLGLFGVIWRYLGLFGAIWVYSALFGAICC